MPRREGSTLTVQSNIFAKNRNTIDARSIIKEGTSVSRVGNHNDSSEHGSSIKAKSFKLSRGDTLRKENYERVLKGHMSRAEMNLVFKIQKYSDNIK